MDPEFRDRVEAGRVLAGMLAGYAGGDVVVLGLPRGGVPVAAEVAAALGATLDVLVVRKLGVPGHEELAMGAVAGVGDAVETVRNGHVLRRAGVDEARFDAVRSREVAELRRRESAYRGGRPAAAVRGRTVILVDDGLATGASMRAAIAAVRRQQPGRLVVAVPLAARATCTELAAEVDEVVCARLPEPFYAVGQGYRDFTATSDDEVRRALARSGTGPADAPGLARPGVSGRGPGSHRGMTLQRIDGYATIESYAALGDGRVTALVAQDGSIDWWTQPVMDSPPVLEAILDPDVGGRFLLAPTAEPTGVSRRYVGDSAVLETTYRVGAATVRVTDALNRGVLGTLPWTELARKVEVDGGEVPMRWEFRPGHRFDDTSATARWYGETPVLTLADQELAVIVGDAGKAELVGNVVRGEFTARPGVTSLVAVVAADAEPLHLPAASDIVDRVDDTVKDWHRWSSRVQYDGPWREAVVRSAIALRQLTFDQSGSILAAATTSLPESLDGKRNYDYRFSWVRDTSFSLDALVRLGLPEEVHTSMSWLLATVAATAPDIRVFYRLDGAPVEAKVRKVTGLHGYRGASPVEVGNQAASQRQLGAYGDLIDAVWRYVNSGNLLNAATGQMIASMADRVCQEWQKKDAGIWELGDDEHYTISKIACWTALERSLQLVDAGQAPGDHAEQWRTTREAIRAYVEEQCWSAEKNSYTFHAGTDKLDCATLLAGRTGFCDRGDPRLAGTVDAIRAELSAGGPLLYRYSGMAGKEGAFVACTFWLVEALTHLDRLDEARGVLEAMLERCNDVGLLSEEIDPESGEFRGNIPQALSHLALIGAATGLNSALSER